MVIFNNILGVFYMSLTLEDVVKELRRCTAELKESNDKWEIANESKTTLRPSNDGTTSKGEQDEHTQ